jgi:hypothetical protein
MNNKLIFLGCIAVVVLGSFLPWAKVEMLGMSETVGGLEGDGLITLIVAIVAGAAVYFTQDKLAGILALVGSAIILIIGLIDFIDLGKVMDGFGLFGDAVNRGIGLYLVLLGSLAGAVLGVLTILKKN